MVVPEGDTGNHVVNYHVTRCSQLDALDSGSIATLLIDTTTFRRLIIFSVGYKLHWENESLLEHFCSRVCLMPPYHNIMSLLCLFVCVKTHKYCM